MQDIPCPLLVDWPYSPRPKTEPWPRLHSHAPRTLDLHQLTKHNLSIFQNVTNSKMAINTSQEQVYRENILLDWPEQTFYYDSRQWWIGLDWTSGYLISTDPGTPTPPPKNLVSRARSQSNNRKFEIFYSLSFLFQSLLLLRFSSSISVHYFFFFFFFKKKNIHLLSSKSSIYLVAFATHIWPFIFGLFTYRLSHPFDSFFNYLNNNL